MKKSDVDLVNGWVRILGLKDHGEIYKPMSTAAKNLLQGLEGEGGKSIARTKKWGNLGLRVYHDRWVWPVTDEFLFPANRKDSKTKQMNKARGNFSKFPAPPGRIEFRFRPCETSPDST